ncbi:exosome complex protein Rrp42, partial [Candidatus Pacearchaeota archaeon]|nr:exosome complex protein Rrp42 [Candidatus Pacearchaeota archaeon]MBD3283632.1 exosome complex protein Rrp42 [Candidatus Pacearchaeota archaeon]
MKLSNINKRKIIKILEENKRFDSRGIFDFRDISIETGISNKAEGSSRVRIGKTEVIVGIKLDVQEPYPDHDDEGTMSTSMEFSSVSSDRYESGPPQIDAIETARVVDRGIRESGIIDWKKLCIKKGEKIWSISIDIYCINDDGNVLDASSLGAAAALRVAKFPKYNEKENKVEYGELTNKSLPLTDNVPFSMTFYKIGKKILVDPTREEEDSSESRLTLAISTDGKEKIINAMQKGGIEPITEDDLN